MAQVDWSDHLGNAASALDVLRQYLAQGGAQNLEDLAEWCQAQAADLWPDQKHDSSTYHDVAKDMVKCAAEVRVGNSTALQSYEEPIFADWPNWTEHLFWVATASEADIVSWAECIEKQAVEVNND